MRCTSSTGSAATSADDLRGDDGHDRAAVEQAAHLLVRHAAGADDEHAPALEIDNGHVVMLLGHESNADRGQLDAAPVEPDGNLGATGDERDPVHPRADDLDPERLERAAVQRRQGCRD